MRHIDGKLVAEPEELAAVTTDSLARYSTILAVYGSHIAGRVAGTYLFGYSNPLAIVGTGTLYPIGVIALRAADYPIVGTLSTKLRIVAQLACNATAPTGTFTYGLYPLTRPGSAGGTGLCIYTVGTVVVGSNGATVSAPTAGSHTSMVGQDLKFP